MSITLINADALCVNLKGDLIVTDPPFEMAGKELANILSGIKSNHLVLLSTMRQIIDFAKHSDWDFSFDFVLDAVVPKKSKSIRQPNYTHTSGAYFTRNGAKSIFNRKLRQRSDTFDNNGYWPTVIRAPRDKMQEFGMAKNEQALIDLIGSFEADSVVDCFAGSGAVGMACFQIDKNCILVERDAEHYQLLKRNFKFIGGKVEELHI